MLPTQNQRIPDFSCSYKKIGLPFLMLCFFSATYPVLYLSNGAKGLSPVGKGFTELSHSMNWPTDASRNWQSASHTVLGPSGWRRHVVFKPLAPEFYCVASDYSRHVVYSSVHPAPLADGNMFEVNLDMRCRLSVS